MGRKPRINVGAAPQFTDAELTVLKDLSSLYPELAKKIIGRNNELAAAIAAYNKTAAKSNYKLYRAIGHTKEEALSILKTIGFSDDEIKDAEKGD